jgi:hypothetical protein
VQQTHTQHSSKLSHNAYTMLAAAHR